MDNETDHSSIQATMVLADYAVVQEGKINIIGAGWTITGPGPVASAVAFVLWVPWARTNERHMWHLALTDEDGQPVVDPERHEVWVGGEFEVGRPPGADPAQPLPVPNAVNVAPLPLQPGSAFRWTLRVNDEIVGNVSFCTRAQMPPTTLAG